MALLMAFAPPLAGAEPSSPTSAGQPSGTAQLHSIDLPTALRLAGAENLDVQIARQRVAEAEAGSLAAKEAFLPALSTGASYRRHDGRIQSTEGDILDVDKQSYTVGGALGAQIDLGEAVYHALEAHRLTTAAAHAFDAQRGESVLAAALAYFDLARSRAQVSVAEEAFRLAQEYEDQLRRAVEIGIAFKGDQLRARGQRQRSEIDVRRAVEEQRSQAARLAQILHLDATVELVPQDGTPTPIELVDLDSPLDAFVGQARAQRPEWKRAEALVDAAHQARRGAVYGPLLPAVGAQAFFGGLGGGRDDATGNFGDSQDYYAGLSWRIGPGGLFDLGRMRTARARSRVAELSQEKQQDVVVREVVETYTRVHSLADQMETAREALHSAEAVMRLTTERREFDVGAVLEHLLAQQDLAQARRQWLQVVADYDKAQYALQRAVGDL